MTWHWVNRYFLMYINSILHRILKTPFHCTGCRVLQHTSEYELWCKHECKTYIQMWIKADRGDACKWSVWCLDHQSLTSKSFDPQVEYVLFSHFDNYPTLRNWWMSPRKDCHCAEVMFPNFCAAIIFRVRLSDHTTLKFLIASLMYIWS